MNYTIKRPFFGQIEIGYLVFWVNQNGIQHDFKKVEDRVNMTPQNTQKKYVHSWA